MPMKIVSVALLATTSFIILFPGNAFAGAKSKIVKEAVEFFLKKTGKNAAEEGAEALTSRLARTAEKHGDDVVEAFRKSGPRAITAIENAGEHGGKVAGLVARKGDDALWVAAAPNRVAIFARFGDDAAEAMIRHGSIAEPVISKFGRPAAQALAPVSSRNARRVAMMADDGFIAGTGKADELLNIIGRYGDRGADFVWRNKGTLALAAALAAFLADPEPFITGAKDLATVATTAIAKPLAEATGQAGVEAAKTINWTLVAGLAASALAAFIGWKYMAYRVVRRGINLASALSGGKRR